MKNKSSRIEKQFKKQRYPIKTKNPKNKKKNNYTKEIGKKLILNAKKRKKRQ